MNGNNPGFMRILMLNYEFPPLGGGAGNANYYLLKEFAKHEDLHIDLVTSSPDKFKVEFSENIRIFKLDVKKKGVHYWRMTEIALWSLKALLFSRKLAKKNDYDLCHAWFGWPGGFVAYLLGLPFIVSLRGSDVPGYNPRLKILDMFLFKPLSKLVWGKAKEVIANSSGLKSLAQKTKKIPIKVIYNGVDTKEFKPGKSSGKRLISTGRLIERKGYHYLIEALRGLDFSLTLIGEGNMENSLKKQAQNLDVEFKGAVSHEKIAKELSKADVFVLPSLNEGMSNSVLEAMASGLPVVVTDVGGTKELVKGNGFVVKRADAKELKKALKRYQNNPELITKHGKKSRELAEKMSWQNVAEEYKGVYEL